MSTDDHVATELLLDEAGALSVRFEAVLREVFLRYASEHSTSSSTSARTIEDVAQPASLSDEPAAGAGGAEDEIFLNARTLSREDLDRFTKDTNGEAMTDETFEECREFFDVLDDRLTFKGFLQLYQLQTENEPSETLNDLTSWGFTDKLESMSSDKDGKVLEEAESDKAPTEKVVATVEATAA